MKTCCTCKASKEESDFHKNRARPDGLQDACKACLKESQKKPGLDGLTPMQRWAKKNPGRVLDYQRRYKYGMTSEQFEQRLNEQDGRCAICREPDRKWCVDHDHTTGAVRSILCYCCNIAIGNLQDSAALASAAAGYLTKHGKA